EVQRPGALDAINTAGAILYIEDNASNIELVRRILERHGSPVRLDVAMLGGLGVDLARHGDYDLILLDAHLPDSSGLEVLTQLRKGEQTRAMPVVMVSADATPSRIEEALAGGAYRYLTKPINVKEFLGVVDEVL